MLTDIRNVLCFEMLALLSAVLYLYKYFIENNSYFYILLD